MPKKFNKYEIKILKKQLRDLIRLVKDARYEIPNAMQLKLKGDKDLRMSIRKDLAGIIKKADNLSKSIDRQTE